MDELLAYVRACRGFTEFITPESLVGNLSGHLALHRSIVRPALASVIRPGDRVLDLGCGLGRVSRLLVDLGARVVGIDISRFALARAAEIVPEATFVWVVGTGELPFPPESFEAVVSTITFQHLQYFPVRHRYFQEVRRVLVDRGRLLAQLSADDSGPHIRWFERGDPSLYLAPDVVCNEEEIRQYLQAVGFEVPRLWRTPQDTARVSWERHLTGRADGWLWVHAMKGENGTGGL